MKKVGLSRPGSVVFISVDASTSPAPKMDASRKQPSIKETIGAVSDAQLHRYNTDTLELMRNNPDYKRFLASLGGAR